MFKTKVYLERGDKEHEIDAHVDLIMFDQFEVQFDTLLDLTSEETEGLRYDALQNYYAWSMEQDSDEDLRGDYLYEQYKERDLG